MLFFSAMWSRSVIQSSFHLLHARSSRTCSMPADIISSLLRFITHFPDNRSTRAHPEGDEPCHYILLWPDAARVSVLSRGPFLAHPFFDRPFSTGNQAEPPIWFFSSWRAVIRLQEFALQLLFSLECRFLKGLPLFNRALPIKALPGAASKRFLPCSGCFSFTVVDIASTRPPFFFPVGHKTSKQFLEGFRVCRRLLTYHYSQVTFLCHFPHPQFLNYDHPPPTAPLDWCRTAPSP